MERLKKILVVDDSGDDRLLTRKILEKYDYSVVEAGNYLEALKHVEKGGVDLVILDLKMPDMDGLELLGIIRKRNTSLSLPIIIYTSTTNIEADDCISQGSNGFARKYNDPRMLIEQVEEALA